MTESLFFCSQSSRESGVDIIGSAPEHQAYVAIECPPPWTPYDLDSKCIPDNLRELGNEIYGDYDRFQTRFLLIYNDQLKQEHYTRVLFFRKPSGLTSAYNKHEFHVTDIQEVAPLVKRYLNGEDVNQDPVESPVRDFFICTHGSRDRCCARFGNPIYHQALKIVEGRSLSDIRIWQASHIGGHRMAPTAVSFPDARYYGYLTPEALTAILTQAGELDWMAQCYRGCGLLPWAVQILERELISSYGWQWFGYHLEGRVLETNEDESVNQVELAVVLPEGDALCAQNNQRHCYTATILLDATKPIYLKGSCTSQEASLVEQYRIEAFATLTK